MSASVEGLGFRVRFSQGSVFTGFLIPAGGFRPQGFVQEDEGLNPINPKP